MRLLISSLFSTFDPSASSFELGMGKWWAMVGPLVVMCWSSFGITTNNSALIVYLFKQVSLQMGQSANKSVVKLVLLFGLVVLVSILWWNEMGLIPYSFVVTGHLSWNLSISLSWFLGGVIATVMVSNVKTLEHLLPFGSPMSLAPALVLIETIGFMIRPFSLAVRLFGNMVAGHLLLTLLGELVQKIYLMSVPTSCVFIMLGCCLSAFELGVGVVQSIIFSSLLFMYWIESL